jgi:isoleucyl-tRNA synthetase
LEDSDYYGASGAVSVFIDDLTNWYVRRSRRRFWKSEHDRDKGWAYATLYHVLVKLSRLLAPFTPFFTEAMYQNLVRSVYPDALKSIHHTRWPQFDPAVVDARLVEEMSLSRQIASLGLGARNSANIKVRQPLARAMAYAGGKLNLRSELVEIVMDELNVKAFEFVEEPRRLVNYRVLPDNKLLGPRFGAQFPKVRAAVAGADPSAVAEVVLAGQPLSLEVDGQMVKLAPEEIVVQTEPVAGLAVSSERGITVAIDANLTSELRAEGLARELVRRVQAMRKEAGFNIDDRIFTSFQFDGKHDILSDVIENWSEYICAETLSTALREEELPEAAYSENHQIEGESIRLAVRKMQK